MTTTTIDEAPASVRAVASEYVSIPDASRESGVAERIIRKWALGGYVGTRRLPRCQPKVRLADILHLIEVNTRPASSQSC